MSNDEEKVGPFEPQEEATAIPTSRGFEGWENRENRKWALERAITRPRSFGGMMTTAPDADGIVKEAEVFLKFLEADQ